tara:strand:- start:376 stop:1056 length:681 start_codon:yes stop_codon:yes gene_type:complete
MPRSKTIKKSIKENDIYVKSLLTQKVLLDFNEANSDMFFTIETKLKKQNEGKCIDEGFVKNNSIKLLSYTSGELYSNKIVLDATFECLITNPAESMIIKCKAITITNIGIKAYIYSDEVKDGNNGPFVIFIARDHHYKNELFSKVKEDDIVYIRVLGKRYELNDTYISIIGELIDINNYEILKNELQDNSTLDGSNEKTRTLSKKSSSKTNKSKIKIHQNIDNEEQ